MKRQIQVSVNAEYDDETMKVTLIVACDKCGYWIEGIEGTKWRLANLGEWIADHVINRRCTEQKFGYRIWWTGLPSTKKLLIAVHNAGAYNRPWFEIDRNIRGEVIGYRPMPSALAVEEYTLHGR